MKKEDIKELLKRKLSKKYTEKDERILEEYLESFQNDMIEWDTKKLGNQKETESRIINSIENEIFRKQKKDFKRNYSSPVWTKVAIVALIVISSFLIFDKFVTEPPQSKINQKLIFLLVPVKTQIL